MPLGASDQHPGRIEEERLRQGAAYVAPHQANVFEHVVIKFGEIFHLAAMPQGRDEIDERTSDLPQDGEPKRVIADIPDRVMVVSLLISSRSGAPGTPPGIPGRSKGIPGGVPGAFQGRFRLFVQAILQGNVRESSLIFHGSSKAKQLKS
jgi:hypothetical protein